MKSYSCYVQELHIERVTDALLAASTALVAVAARSLSEVADDVTLPQFRALVVLTHTPLPMGHLARELDCSPSAATRLCDRLVRKGLVTRGTAATSRREVEVTISDDGAKLVGDVLRRRRKEIERIVGAVPETKRAAMISALEAFSVAAASGAAPLEQSWSTGWDL